MGNNRIGEACWYKLPEDFNRATDWEPGTLRAWSTDHTEYDSGPGHYPVAIIEDKATKKCIVVYASRISFADEKPKR